MAAEKAASTVGELARGFRLYLGRTPLKGLPGERPGSGVGASVEIQDFRSYVPGDDPRSIDWKAYARTEVLTVRLYREEVVPRVDIIVDETASMAIPPEKKTRLVELCTFFGFLAKQDHAPCRLVGFESTRDVSDPLEIELGSFQAPYPWPNLSPLSMRRRSVRIVISDFLFPHNPGSLLSLLSQAAGRLCLIRLNSPEELSPSFTGPYKLIDSEGGGTLQLEVSREAVQGYLERLGKLFSDLEREAARVHASSCALRTDMSLEETFKELVKAQIVEAL